MGNVRHSDQPVWCVTCEPHVNTRLKRVFKRAKQTRKFVYLSATEEVSRDLEWFLQRYPMEVSHPEELERLARGFDRRRESLVGIMDGSVQLPECAMDLPPRPYQNQAATFCLESGSLLLADELGLGKTISAITLLSHRETLPALVVVPAHLPLQWKAEIERFLPFYYVHILKKSTPYSLDHKGRNPDVVIASYHKLDGWAPHLSDRVKTVVFDECQELRVGRTSSRPVSNKYAAAEVVVEKAKWRLGLSATPIYNYGDEFYSVINILKPDALGDRFEFLREWCVAAYGGKHRIRDPRAFGAYLDEMGLMIRRTRKQVRRELPDLQRVVHEVDTTVDISNEGAAMELAQIIVSQAGGLEKMKAAGEFDMRLRLATGIEKAPYVAEFVRILAENTPVVLYGWHRAVYDIWHEKLKDLRPAWYTGSESSPKKAREIERFVEGDTPVLMMSLRSGQGVDGLQKVCCTAVIGELDWSPGVLEQCIGRVHRDGQGEPVTAYYLVANDGSDPVMVDTLGLKKAQLDGVKEPFGDLTIPKEVDPHHIRRLAEDYLRRRQK